MFHMHVFYTAKDSETLSAFFKAVKEAGIIETTRAEEGNIRYEYYFSAERDNEILIVEQWTNRQAQAYHDSLPHIAHLMEIKAQYGIETVAEEVN